MKLSFSWTVKCDLCDWSMAGYSVKSFCEEEIKRQRLNGCNK